MVKGRKVLGGNRIHPPPTNPDVSINSWGQPVEGGATTVSQYASLT